MYTSDNEAEKIYSVLFDRKIPEIIRSRFNIVSKKIDNNYPQNEVATYYDLIRTVNDLEALELAARYLGRVPMLSEKIKVMVYLAETIPDNYKDFINESSQGFSVYGSLVSSVMRTIIKMPKGLFILLVKKL